MLSENSYEIIKRLRNKEDVYCYDIKTRKKHLIIGYKIQVYEEIDGHTKVDERVSLDTVGYLTTIHYTLDPPPAPYDELKECIVMIKEDSSYYSQKKEKLLELLEKHKDKLL
jgi:hypothetical protein